MNAPPKILVFDIKKDYLALENIFPLIWIFVLPGAGFRWNPLEPAIADCHQWAGILAATISNSCGFFGGQSTENFLYSCLLSLYRKYDVKNGVFPCLFDLRDFLLWMKKNKRIDVYSGEKNWYSRVMNRLRSICDALGDTVCCSQGFPLSDQLSHHIVFDLSALKQDVQSFFTECFLTQVVYYRMGTVQRGGALRNIAVFDEGKRLMPKFKEGAQQAISNMSNIVALGREFGIGFVVADCDPSLLADSIKASAYMRVCFNQTFGKDVTDSARSMGLDMDQAAAIRSLGTGDAIIRLSGRIDRPFVLKVMK